MRKRAARSTNVRPAKSGNDQNRRRRRSTPLAVSSASFRCSGRRTREGRLRRDFGRCFGRNFDGLPLRAWNGIRRRRGNARRLTRRSFRRSRRPGRLGIGIIWNRHGIVRIRIGISHSIRSERVVVDLGVDAGRLQYTSSFRRAGSSGMTTIMPNDGSLPCGAQCQRRWEWGSPPPSTPLPGRRACYLRCVGTVHGIAACARS